MTGLPPGEFVPDGVSKRELRDEVNVRTHRAGYTTRDGGPIPLKIMGRVAWGRQKLNVWPRDAAGRLIDDE